MWNIIKKLKSQNKIFQKCILVAWVNLLVILLTCCSDSPPTENAILASIFPTTSFTPQITLTHRPSPTPSSTVSVTPTSTQASTPTTTLTPTPDIPVISEENASNLVELARFGNGSVNDLVWSPDSNQLVAASSIGVFLYNARTFDLEKYIDTGAWIYSIAISTDGKMIAAGSCSQYITDAGECVAGKIFIIDAATGKILSAIEAHKSIVSGVAFSPDGTILASTGCGWLDDWKMCSQGELSLWDVKTGKPISSFTGHRGIITDIAFHPDGLHVASSSDDGFTLLWNVRTGQYRIFYKANEKPIHAIAFSPDGNMLAAGSCAEAESPGGGYCLKGNVTLWEISTGQIIHTFEGHSREVLSLAFCPDGTKLASGGGTRSHAYSYNGQTLSSEEDAEESAVRVWDISSGDILYTFTDARRAISNLAFSPDGESLASVSADASIRIYDTTEWGLKETFSDNIRSVNSVAFNFDGTLLALGSDDGIIQIWDMPNRKLLIEFEAYPGTVTSVAFSPNSKVLVTGGGYWGDSSVRIWEVKTGQLIKTLEPSQTWVYSVAFSPNGLLIASGNFGDGMTAWEAVTGRFAGVFECEFCGGETHIYFRDDSKYLITTDYGYLQVWDVSTKSLIQSLDLRGMGLLSFAYSEKAQVFAVDGSVEWQRAVIISELSYGQVRYNLSIDTYSRILSITFSPNGEIVIAGTSREESSVYVWSLDGERRNILKSHTGGIICLAFDPAGRLIASGSDDGSVRFWGLKA